MGAQQRPVVLAWFFVPFPRGHVPPHYKQRTREWRAVAFGIELDHQVSHLARLLDDIPRLPHTVEHRLAGLHPLIHCTKPLCQATVVHEVHRLVRPDP